MEKTDKFIGVEELASYEIGYWEISTYERKDGTRYQVWFDPITGLEREVDLSDGALNE